MNKKTKRILHIITLIGSRSAFAGAIISGAIVVLFLVSTITGYKKLTAFLMNYSSVAIMILMVLSILSLVCISIYILYNIFSRPSMEEIEEGILKNDK